ncbi:MAG: DUF4430 domain-containing protein [Candidatus Faecalibacterium intestinavium]|uniref:DUF4430 domain-containing protein n=1 Tax=Candidatus Faecalibacterium intestinavium TaxID=2838580 RepID=A0A9E2KJZ8_9FIRM|nr:DUF4430 domain-containing protein [Candidatus Faecalibacterium intestinavium]
MKLMHTFAALALSAALSLTLLAGCGSASSAPSSTAAASSSTVAASSEAAESAASTEEEKIKAVFTVNYEDGTSENVDLEVADGTLLSDALRDAGVISAEEAEAGFVTVVNGVTADWDADGAWWCLTDAEGEMTSVGVGEIALHDGDSYAFTYTVG